MALHSRGSADRLRVTQIPPPPATGLVTVGMCGLEVCCRLMKSHAVSRDLQLAVIALMSKIQAISHEH